MALLLLKGAVAPVLAYQWFPSCQEWCGCSKRKTPWCSCLLMLRKKSPFLIFSWFPFVGAVVALLNGTPLTLKLMWLFSSQWCASHLKTHEVALFKKKKKILPLHFLITLNLFFVLGQTSPRAGNGRIGSKVLFPTFGSPLVFFCHPSNLPLMVRFFPFLS